MLRWSSPVSVSGYQLGIKPAFPSFTAPPAVSVRLPCFIRCVRGSQSQTSNSAGVYPQRNSWSKSFGLIPCQLNCHARLFFSFCKLVEPLPYQMILHWLNKKSAQESRKRKRERLEELQKSVAKLQQENDELRKANHLLQQMVGPLSHVPGHGAQTLVGPHDGIPLPSEHGLWHAQVGLLLSSRPEPPSSVTR